MVVMTKFPDEYPLSQQSVTKIEWYGALSKEEPGIDPEMAKFIDYRWVDFCVTLNNGDAYVFTAGTPDFIKEVMERENMKSWLEPGCIVVREINQECILDAVETWLKQADTYGLDHKAVLQTQ